MATKTQNRKRKKQSFKLPVGIIVVLVCAAVLAALALGPGFHAPGAAVSSSSKALEQHSYDWSGLTQQENGRKVYQNAQGVSAAAGIDVSSHQGTIDWNAVASDGIQFAFVRVGSRGYQTGEIYYDEQFEANFTGAQAAGLKVGVYFYSQAVNEQEARQEAQVVLQALDGRACQLPVVIDYEEVLEEEVRTGQMTNEERTAVVQAFCEEVKQAGYTPMLYSTRSMLLDRFDLTQLPDVKLWAAEFNELPDFPYTFDIWQYTPRGRVAGIGPDVDLNLYLSGWEG